MPKPLTQCAVLVVEDMDENRQLIRELLSRLGVTILEAANGQEALSMARRAHPDLILMDLSLPLLDGWQAATALKADRATAGIPIFPMSAHATPDDERRALSLGLPGFIRQPIDVPAFLQTIAHHLRLGAG